ncbi:hypothetical protein LSH36_159g06030 [Paralvinella palmiformis]|uniref:E3 ubiquitin-protein ligase PPP1R11 n=1 Tax=Paralvinella palmiformis TaxID=53620 RepID=A0AAD9N8M1_9ANNE|nr:hypothetical protein LSH36_159g06030 [Paralvinella palmiformis]
MAEAAVLLTNETTVTETIQEQPVRSPRIVLKLHKPKSEKQVKWKQDTVDNENMNKKKSKCCCIYEKPKLFGESSSESDEDCTDNCHGHKHKCYRRRPPEKEPHQSEEQS